MVFWFLKTLSEHPSEDLNASETLRPAVPSLCSFRHLLCMLFSSSSNGESKLVTCFHPPHHLPTLHNRHAPKKAGAVFELGVPKLVVLKPGCLRLLRRSALLRSLRPFALFSALLRTCVRALLRSFALFCALLRAFAYFCVRLRLDDRVWELQIESWSFCCGGPQNQDPSPPPLWKYFVARERDRSAWIFPGSQAAQRSQVPRAHGQRGREGFGQFIENNEKRFSSVHTRRVRRRLVISKRFLEGLLEGYLKASTFWKGS